MFGFINEETAAKLGLTHHAGYYGIPAWYAAEGENAGTLMPKWAPMGFLIIAALHVEGFMRAILYPEDEPVIQITLKKKIKRDNNKG